jgi:hypothetical protein
MALPGIGARSGVAPVPSGIRLSKAGTKAADAVGMLTINTLVKPALASNAAVRTARHSPRLMGFWWLQAIFNFANS